MTSSQKKYFFWQETFLSIKNTKMERINGETFHISVDHGRQRILNLHFRQALGTLNKYYSCVTAGT